MARTKLRRWPWRLEFLSCKKNEDTNDEKKMPFQVLRIDKAVDFTTEETKNITKQRGGG